MTENPTRRWLQSRMSDAPPELAADILRLIETTPDLDLSDPVTALATAALAGLEQVADGAGERGEALRLLAADAALTYAFEAAADSGRTAPPWYTSRLPAHPLRRSARRRSRHPGDPL